MKKEIDARGLACPEPVLLAKKMIEEAGECVVIVDDASARDNVCRMAESLGCTAVVHESGGAVSIDITGGTGYRVAESIPTASGPTVVVFPCDTMGRGDDELGMVLIKAFLHTLGEVSPPPDVMIFFNTGVRLATEASQVLDDLCDLEHRGTRIMVCGTCLDYFGLKDNLKAGGISNMYDITETMLSAGRVLRI